MLEGRRVLVVEREFLVAMDLQRMLEGARAGPIVFARHAGELAGEGGWPDVTLAIVETAPDAESSTTLIDQLRAAGIPVIATTAGLSLHTVRDDIPILRKPVVEADLLDACALALGAVPR